MAKDKAGNSGRKGKYESHVKPYFDEIENWLNKGLTEKQISKRLGVAYSSFSSYKNIYPEFLELLKKKRHGLIDDVKGALVKRALGYEYEETTTYIRQEGDKQVKTIEKKKKHQPPDVGACHLLLKNLDEDWSNDDAKTMARKDKELELKQKQVEANTW